MEEFVKGEEGSRGLRALTLQLNADDDDDDDASVTSLGWNNGKSGGDLESWDDIMKKFVWRAVEYF
ncbi:unnamed protein product [Citrullus colocynthis]|uniref:Uncharacterized protein n=1 Tax=Citrullus colocynthis TaxID=252529 RepID=A0ABP0YF13_9ROSI